MSGRARGLTLAALLFGCVLIALCVTPRRDTSMTGFGTPWLFAGLDRFDVLDDGWITWVLDATRGEARRPLFWGMARLIAVDRSFLHAIAFAVVALLSAVLIDVRGAVERAGRHPILTSPPPRALAGGFLAATIWAVHPARLEAAADWASRGTLLGAACVCVAALALPYALTSARLNRFGPVVCALAFALALAADPLLCFAPVAFLALVLWVRHVQTETDTRSARRLLVLPCLAAAISLVANLSVREPGGGAPFLPSLLATASALVRPLRALLWPFGLHPAYDPPSGFPDTIAPSLWIDGVTVLALAGACIVGMRRRAGWGYALLAYIALAAGPALLRREPVGTDVDGYVATIPLFLAAGAVVARFRNPARTAAIAAAALVAVACGVKTRLELGAWRDEPTLVRHVLDLDPANERALVAEGDAARRAGAPVDTAATWYRRALDAGDWRPLAHARLGAVLLETGDISGARKHLEHAVAIAPWLPASRFDLGALELREGNLPHALGHLEAAARLDTESMEVWRVLANLKDATGDTEGAAAALRRASQLRPADR